MPDTRITGPIISSKDRSDIAYAVGKGVDFIAMSFIRNAQDIETVKTIIQNAGHQTPVIAKIEKPEALVPRTLHQIVKAADGVMVARGDMGIECDIVDLPRFQEAIIKEAKQQSKPVIVATQMLESMMTNTVPNRSDVSDIADAVKDGADYTMLSGETATGDYPVECVQMMDRILKAYEQDKPKPADKLSLKRPADFVGVLRDQVKRWLNRQ